MDHMILLMLYALEKTIQGIHYIVCNVNREEARREELFDHTIRT
jgi:hypothetical protein